MSHNELFRSDQIEFKSPSSNMIDIHDPQQSIHYIISAHISKNNANKAEGAQIHKLTHILDHR